MTTAVLIPFTCAKIRFQRWQEKRRKILDMDTEEELIEGFKVTLHSSSAVAEYRF